MTIRLYVDDIRPYVPASDLLRITEGLKDGFHRSGQLLDIGQLPVILWKAGKEKTIPAWGISGGANERRISIYIDPSNPHLREENLERRLSLVATHEIHHTIRRRHDVKFTETLGECLVSEGLAQNFETEAGHPVSFWSTLVQGDALSNFAERAKSALNDKCDRSWIRGTENDLLLPLGCGYSLSFALVRNWLALNNLTASEAVHVEANDVLQPWLKGEIDINNARTHPQRTTIANKRFTPPAFEVLSL